MRARRLILRAVSGTFLNGTLMLDMNILLDFQLVWLECELCTKRSASRVKSCLLHMRSNRKHVNTAYLCNGTILVRYCFNLYFISVNIHWKDQKMFDDEFIKLHTNDHRRYAKSSRRPHMLSLWITAIMLFSFTVFNWNQFYLCHKGLSEFEVNTQTKQPIIKPRWLPSGFLNQSQYFFIRVPVKSAYCRQESVMSCLYIFVEVMIRAPLQIFKEVF